MTGSRFNGKAIPHKRGEHTEVRWYVVVEGRKVPVCSRELAETYQAEYAKKGLSSTIEVEKVQLNIFEEW